MLIKPYGDVLQNCNPPSIEDSYLGVVVDNNDPNKLGRLRVLIPMYEDLDIDEYPWACPELDTFLGNSPNSVSFNVPEIGSQVRVTFPTKDIYAPYYSGCELNEENKCTFFDDEYPDAYGSKDSVGNFIKINKSTKEVHIQHSSTLNLQIAEDGTFAVTNPNGTYLVADPVGNISLDGAKIVTADCDEIKVKTGAVTMDSTSTTFTGDVKISGSFTPIAGISTSVPVPNGGLLVFTNGILTAHLKGA